jgi:hypothetical protein
MLEEVVLKQRTPHFFTELKHDLPHTGPKRKGQAVVQWDPHLFPPYHGYYLLEDRQGLKRFVKAENILPSDEPRRSPPKIRFAPDVGVKLIPRYDDPTNAIAWNSNYHKDVAKNQRWQQQQWHEAREEKNKHRRLVVASIGMREFRKRVLATLVDHVHAARARSEFRRYIVPVLVDHSHRLRWTWALQRHHAKAKFQQSVVGALPSHVHLMRLKWKFKETFSQTVVPAIVDHSHRLRWKCSLERHHSKSKFQEKVLGFLGGHHRRLQMKWEAKTMFSRIVLPGLEEHALMLQLEWAINKWYDNHEDNNNEDGEAHIAGAIDHDDDGNENDGGGAIDHIGGGNDEAQDNERDDDGDEDNPEDDDDENVGGQTASTTADPTTPAIPSRTPRQRRQASVPVPNTDGATVWVDGQRRSRRLQPPLGSIVVNGLRRSARFI